MNKKSPSCLCCKGTCDCEYGCDHPHNERKLSELVNQIIGCGKRFEISWNKMIINTVCGMNGQITHEVHLCQECQEKIK